MKIRIIKFEIYEEQDLEDETNERLRGESLTRITSIDISKPRDGYIQITVMGEQNES